MTAPQYQGHGPFLPTALPSQGSAYICIVKNSSLYPCSSQWMGGQKGQGKGIYFTLKSMSQKLHTPFCTQNFGKEPSHMATHTAGEAGCFGSHLSIHMSDYIILMQKDPPETAASALDCSSAFSNMHNMCFDKGKKLTSERKIEESTKGRDSMLTKKAFREEPKLIWYKEIHKDD